MDDEINQMSKEKELSKDILNKLEREKSILINKNEDMKKK